MAFSTGKVTTRLVDGEVIFWTREVRRGDQPERTLVCLLEGRFTGKVFPSFDLNRTTSLGVSLLDQIAFHYRILS
jgi:hypothetical protein